MGKGHSDRGATTHATSHSRERTSPMRNLSQLAYTHPCQHPRNGCPSRDSLMAWQKALIPLPWSIQKFCTPSAGTMPSGLSCRLRGRSEAQDMSSFHSEEFSRRAVPPLRSPANPAHAVIADRAGSAGGRSAVLHRDLLGVLNLPCLPALHAVYSHLLHRTNRSVLIECRRVSILLQRFWLQVGAWLQRPCQDRRQDRLCNQDIGPSTGFTLCQPNTFDLYRRVPT